MEEPQGTASALPWLMGNTGELLHQPPTHHPCLKAFAVGLQEDLQRRAHPHRTAQHRHWREGNLKQSTTGRFKGYRKCSLSMLTALQEAPYGVHANASILFIHEGLRSLLLQRISPFPLLTTPWFPHAAVSEQVHGGSPTG